MSMFKISFGTCLFLIILNSFIMDTETARCCLSYTPRPVRCSRLKGFSIQEITGTCDISAIVFETQNGHFICADPTMRWTRDRISCLRKKAVVMGNSGTLK